MGDTRRTDTRSLVEIGRRRLQVEVVGSGPTVLLEQGGEGQGVGTWPSVLVESLAEFATVISYDRAGTGKSDPGPMPRTVARMTDDLNMLLHHVDAPLPAVFVGWSYGGLVLSMYAGRFPWDVSGLVYIDPTPTERAPHFRLGGAWQRGLYALGATGLINTPTGEKAARALIKQTDSSPEYTAAMLTFLRDKSAVAVQQKTLSMHSRNMREIEDVLTDRGLPTVPITVITAGQRPNSPKMVEMTAWMTASHERIAQRSPNGQVVVTEKSKHHEIPAKEPEVVVAAVRRALGLSA